jgi:selenoprotein W-related protein
MSEVEDVIALAYACDREGREAEAVVHYDRAFALGVPEPARRGFLVGYGSTLRNVGRLRESERILRGALEAYPGDRALAAFLALTLGSAGRTSAALVAALDAMAVAEYARALASYREELVAADATRLVAVELRYCPKCRWLGRAAWLAQELLTTFPSELTVTLAPGSAGSFEVRVDGETVFSRAEAGRFPEPKELKQRIRDLVDPARDLGHSDTP